MPDTREQIANSFERHLEHFGFRKTAVADIAKELRISKKTIYVHYESKNEILKYVVERRAEEEKRRIASALEQLPTYRARLEGLIGIVFGFVRDWWRQNSESEFLERLEISERAFLDAYTGLIREYVTEGVSSGEFEVSDIETTVRLIGGLILAGTRMLLEDTEIEVEPHVARAVDCLLGC